MGYIITYAPINVKPHYHIYGLRVGESTINLPPGVSGFSGMEWWTGTVEWNGGLEWWTGMVEWNGLIGISNHCQLFAVTTQQFVYTSVGR